ncbi:MAG: YfcE family phosphodiesterase [Pirellulaceae bacterium]
MQIAVLSDTHGHVGNTLEAVRLLESFEIGAVLHCGDIGSPAIPTLLSDWPTHYVLGNVDHDDARLREAIQLSGGTLHGRYCELVLETIRIAMLHGDDETLLRETIERGAFDLLCHGHTHRQARQQAGPTLVLNPGALYRARPHSLAVVDLPSLEVAVLEF